MDWTQLIVVIVSMGGAALVWYLNERSKRGFEDYVRREQRYVELVKALRGFHAGSKDSNAKERFLLELDLSWLYCSDEVIRAAYDFLRTVRTEEGKSHTDDQRRDAVGTLMFTIRQDLLRRKPLKNSNLSPEEFQILNIPGESQQLEGS